MKLHMQRNYQELKQVGALSIENSYLNQLNLMNELANKQEGMLESLKDDLNEQIKTNIYETMLTMQQMDMQPPSLVASEIESNTSDSLNSLTSASTVTTLISTMKSLQQEMKELKQVQQRKPVVDKTINPRTGKQWKRYCWSCGCCPHSGRCCPNKLPDHRDEATFNNSLGGSNKFCRPVQD